MPIMFRALSSYHSEVSLPEDPSLDALQNLVGGMIEFVYFSDGSALMVDEEGKIKGKPVNDTATAICIAKGRWGDSIAGDAVFFSAEEMASMGAD